MTSTYTDTNKWVLISRAPELYSLSVTKKNFFDLRMVALRMDDGGLMLYSPIGSVSNQALHELSALGAVHYIVAPNYYHNLGIARFSDLYPMAGLFAHKDAIPRLNRVTGKQFADVTALEGLLPQGVRLTAPSGLKTGELWILADSKDSGKILICCDSFFNVGVKRGEIFYWILRLTGGAPGLRVSRVFRIIAQQDRLQYKSWMADTLSNFTPNTLVPAHGAILTSPNLAQKLLDLV